MYNYLLTYILAGETKYTWFDSEDELNKFVDKHDDIIVIEDALELKVIRHVL